jgi:glutathione synthase/RimK-type ligase-like ATP-grasp enzyme
MWETKRDYWKYYYGSIYDAYQKHNIQKHVQPPEYQILFEDKYICYQLCKSNDIPLPMLHGCIFPNQAYKETIYRVLSKNKMQRLIIKPLRGKGGKDIFLAYFKEGKYYIRDSKRTDFLENFKLQKVSIIQDYIEQHSCMSLVSDSVNTLRIVTLLTQNNVPIIVCGTARFGLADSFVDNMSAGGIGAGIDINNGCLFPKAFDLLGNSYVRHPQSKIAFKDFQIPKWQEVVDLAKSTQKAFFYYKLIGLDIAITPDRPIIIEINGTPDTASEEINAPLLLDPIVREEFMKYNLLVNKLLYR